MTCYKGAVPLGHASFSLCVKVRDLHEVMFRLPSVYKTHSSARATSFDGKCHAMLAKVRIIFILVK